MVEANRRNGNEEEGEEGAQKVSLRLLKLTEIRPGHTVLDIATGLWRTSHFCGSMCWQSGIYSGYRRLTKDVGNCKRKKCSSWLSKYYI